MFRRVPSGASEERPPAVNHVDPPDLSLWPTLRHLFPLWWAQRRLVAIGLSCSLVFTGLSLLIPILIQRTIDNAIVGADHGAARPVPVADPRRSRPSASASTSCAAC